MAGADATWEILGIMLVLVAPLYGHAAYMIWKRFQTKQNTSDISDHADDIQQNTEDIQEINETLSRVEYNVELIMNDLRVIHDNTADSNHCGSENCRWCDGSADESE